jgi:hypothetical protein
MRSMTQNDPSAQSRDRKKHCVDVTYAFRCLQVAIVDCLSVPVQEWLQEIASSSTIESMIRGLKHVAVTASECLRIR